MCWSFTRSLDRLPCRFLARLSVCSLLLGSGGRSSRNGKGATYFPSASLCKLFSITWINCLPSIERPTFLSSLFLLNTDELMLSHFSQTWIMFSHSLNTVGRPLSRTNVLFTDIRVWWTLPKQVSPTMIHSNLCLWANVTFPDPVFWSITWWAVDKSRPIIKSARASESGGMNSECPSDECNDVQFPVSVFLPSHLECYCI